MPVTITVTNGNNSGAGSLRQALLDVADGDTINFSSTVTTITLTSGELETSGKTFTIAGPGSSLLTIQRSSAPMTPDFRIFHIRPDPVLTGPITISGLTLSNGKVGAVDTSDGGGGMLIGGTPSGSIGLITLTDVRIQNCSSPNKGGGLSNSGTLHLEDCVFSNNTVDSASDGEGGGFWDQGTTDGSNVTIESNSVTAVGDAIGGGYRSDGATTDGTRWVFSSNSLDAGGLALGAGLCDGGTGTWVECSVKNNDIMSGGTRNGAGLAATSTVTLTRCAVHGNSTADNGGGCFFDSGTTAFIRNSTISGNVATNGAGIYATASTVDIDNSTITLNTATKGGGIFNIDGTLNFFDTIVSQNTGDFDIWSETCATVSDGHNLIGSHGEDTGASYTGSMTDLISSTPGLAILQDNGGPTFTHRILAGSIAINAGDNTGAPSTDQRGTGFPRIITAIIDIGAYEFDPDAGGGGNGNGNCPPCARLVATCQGTLVTNCNPEAKLKRC